MSVQIPENRLKIISIFYYAMVALSAIIIIRIIYIQYFKGTELRDKAKERLIKIREIKANRGNIYSYDSELLATSLPRFDVYVDFSTKTVSDKDFNNNIDSLCIYLNKYFPNKSVSEYKKLLKSYRNRNERYGRLLINLNYKQIKLVRSFPLFRLGRFRGGLIEEVSDTRVYPFGILARRTIGTSKSFSKSGLEKTYDVHLAGVNGLAYFRRLAGGNYKPLNTIRKPKEGIDIVLTLEVKYQDIVENALLKSLQKHNAQWGCAILMEVETGDIKAIANLTRYPNNTYLEDENYAITTNFEPGSIFKTFAFLSLIEDKLINLKDTINTNNGKFIYGKDTITDVHKLGKISIRKAFEESSNVAMWKLMIKNYAARPNKFLDKLKEMKMDVPLDLDVEKENIKGAYFPTPSDKRWSKTDLPSIATGYSITISPLHILTYYNAIANDGKLVQPRIVSEFQYAGKTIKTFKPVVIKNQICSKATIDTLKSLLEGVVQNGTARIMKNSVCRMAGKTGTVRDRTRLKGEDTLKVKPYISSFAGFFPVEKPKFSCIVVVGRPQSGVIYGGSVAAPVFKEIAETIFATEIGLTEYQHKAEPLVKIPSVSKANVKTIKALGEIIYNDKSNFKIPQYEWVDFEYQNKPVLKKSELNLKTIPDVKGMNLKDATYLLESLGLTVEAIGCGRVYSQSIPPNSPINKGQKIQLILKI